MANTWNESGTTWGTNRWGTTDAFALGWGAQAWNDGELGQLNDSIVTPTGVSSTSSVGSVSITAEINTGWGQDGWGVEYWGQSGQTVVIVSGVEATTGIGEDVSWVNKLGILEQLVGVVNIS